MRAKSVKARVFLVLIVIFATLTLASAAAGWQLKQAPIMTDWAAQVNSANPLPEYPRPQLVRSDWLNLNGIWQFKRGYAPDTVPVGQNLGGDILVPYPVESAISGVMAHYDRVWYRRTFTVPSAWAGKKIMLNFGAVDWEAQIYVNGTSVGTHQGGYDPFSYDITSYLTPSGAQEIIVRVYDPTDSGGQPRGKQVNGPGGIFYTATTGIWQTVWLEPVAATSISSLKIVPDVDGSRLKLTVNTIGPTTGMTVTATAKDGATTVGAVTGSPNTELYISIPSPKLWSPDSPFLYDLNISLDSGATVMDSVTSYFGMRKIARALVNGIYKLVLNGQFVFQIGPLDQGFWPDGIYTAPTDAALKWDIETEKQLGFNCVRKHVKIEPARWYYWADKLGLMIWQDMPSGNNGTTAEKTQFEIELQRMIENHWNSPSIIMWVVFNEGWGQYDTVRLTNWVMGFDPSRIVNCASGWSDFEVGHVIDYHSYPSPVCPTSSTRARVCGEYGGIGYAITGHMWDPNSWGYTMVTSSGDLTDLYGQFTSTQVGGFKTNNGLSAAIYTQITDVETEINGLVTYDRKVIKPIISAIYDANHFQYVATTFTITASAATGGTISPSGSVVVNQATNKTFTIAENPTGYAISNVTVDSVPQGAITSYTFSNIIANHTISAAFVTVPTFTITASAGTGGTISPSGAVIVNQGGSKVFTIAPSVGYAISNVTVDGVSKGAITTFTFNNVTVSHTISAAFVAMPAKTITASAGANGSISPSGAVVVNYGANQTFTFPANTGYQVANVTVDSVSQGAITSYTFTNVTANHTISATFMVLTPVAYYQFENNVNDTQGAYNGTAYGTPTYVTGKVGALAIQFNGTNQYVSITRPVSTNWTISFFVKTTQTSPTGSQWYNGNGIVDAEVGGVTDDFGISYLNSKVAFGVGNGDTTLQSTSTINGGSWKHVACTRNSATGQMKVYINGVLEATTTGPTGAKSVPATMHFGNLQTNINYFSGAIDQVKIFNSVLTATDITNLALDGTIYTITASAGTGGSISPTGAVAVNYGASQTFTFPPNVGYVISQVTVDSVNQGALSSYTFSNVTAAHTISATFVLTTKTITAIAEGNGSISPSGAVVVNYGANQTFTITPNIGYKIASVTVDGVNAGAGGSYTFSNVIINHTIAAAFTPITYTITSSAGANGSVAPSGAVTMNYGANQTFTFSHSAGCGIVDMKVDGASIVPVVSYTFNNVIANHTISATFAKLIGMNNKSALTDSKVIGRAVKVWGKVKSINGATSFVIADSYNASGITVMVNGVALPAVFDTTKTVLVTGLLTKDDSGNLIVNAQDVK
ncbi:MAG: hypothetical protein NT018_05225 [Armatimonadetes bacterium]|nr:hypothetical protein [Armatimonadota bacterium]